MSDALTVDWDDDVPLNGHRHVQEESFETARPAPVFRKDPLPPKSSRADLPHSLEIETHLLSTCFIEEGGALDACVESEVSPDDFEGPQHRTIFGAMLRLHSSKNPVATWTVMEELKRTGELDEAGGLPMLTQVSSVLSTTARVPYLIRNLRELSVRRRLILGTTSIRDAAQDVSSDLSETLTSAIDRISRIRDGASNTTASAIMDRSFRMDRLLSKPEHVFAIADIPVCTRGNITTIYSTPKVGKSAFIGGMMASTIAPPSSGRDTFAVSGPNYANHAVMHFDTEQSPYDWQQLIQRQVLRRAGVQEPPKWLMSFTIAGMEAGAAQRFIQSAVRLARRTHGGIHSIFIDGVADLVNDPNSPDECFPLVARLHGLAIEHDCAIINILHLNPTSGRDKNEKGRGHLGSQLERKCESNLTLAKDGDITTVRAEGRQRGRPIPPDKAPSFRWDDESQMHRSCATPASNEESGESSSKKGRPEQFSYSIYAALMPKRADHPLPLGQLAKRLSVNKPISSKQLHSALIRWVEQGMVEAIDTPLGRVYRQAV